ncbi:hypothetical protein [Nitrospirillum bahiense]|uniref:hypothetical protein n=1 Tax=Nitrospirillum amazonense TaxID=28077 RepID=UPI0011A4DA49|nr:hypothetical protein [Nitrospirillum amazonense]
MEYDGLFDFWANVGPSNRIHPADAPVLARLDEGNQNWNQQHPAPEELDGLDLRCLPLPFIGPLRTAPVVFLTLLPGLEEDDVEEAATEAGQHRYHLMRQGNQPLPLNGEIGGAWKWWKARTARLGDPMMLRHHVAFLDIGAYHSKKAPDRQTLAALPSSRMAIDWAQQVLFPQAVKGERVVVCLRAARMWGLRRNRCQGSLFVPETPRSGHLGQGKIANAAVAAIKSRLGLTGF